MQISWDILFRSFRERLPDRNYLQGREVVSADENNGVAYLTFSDGSTVEADLVIGVDGVGSIVRKAVAGDDAAPEYAGYAVFTPKLICRTRPQKRCASALHSTICLGPTYLDTWLRVPMALLSQAVVDTIGFGIGGCRMRMARSRVR
jgi:2-polyprenyl-6-methoxyphenol hydroxylase-like FAD-dependent oxidoreductase